MCCRYSVALIKSAEADNKACICVGSGVSAGDEVVGLDDRLAYFSAAVPVASEDASAVAEDHNFAHPMLNIVFNEGSVAFALFLKLRSLHPFIVTRSRAANGRPGDKLEPSLHAHDARGYLHHVKNGEKSDESLKPSHFNRFVVDAGRFETEVHCCNLRMAARAHAKSVNHIQSHTFSQNLAVCTSLSPFLDPSGYLVGLAKPENEECKVPLVR
jgi:hypothetical protein